MGQIFKIGRFLPVAAMVLAMSLACLHAGPANAAGTIPVCAAEEAEAAGVDEGANAGGDAVGDGIGALGLPVADEGLQEQDNQINANLAAMTGFLVTIATSTCDTNNTLSTPPGATAFSAWSLGVDTEPDVAVIPTQVAGFTGVAASPMAKEVDVENSAALKVIELATDGGPESALADAREAGRKNMEGIALTNIGTDKTMLTGEDAINEKIKTSANIKDLLANEGAVQISIADTLSRIDEGVNQLAIDEAETDLDKANQQKAEWYDRYKTAILFGAGSALLLTAG